MTDAEKAAVRAAKNEYLRRYRRENPDKYREIQERYWIKRGQKLLAESGGAATA